MRTGELFGDLRAELQSRPSARSWWRLCGLLERFDEARLRHEVVPYLQGSLDRFPPALRRAPRRWLERGLRGEPWAPLALVRRLEVDPQLTAGDPAKLLGHPDLVAIEQLEMGGWRGHDLFAPLLDAPWLESLRRWRISPPEEDGWTFGEFLFNTRGRLHSLTHLDASLCGLDGDDLTLMGDSAPLRGLHWLDLSFNTSIGEYGLERIDWAEAFPELRELRMSGSAVYVFAPSFFAISTLERLEFALNGEGQGTLGREIARHPALREVDLQHNDLQSDFLHWLTEAPLPRLERVQLGGNALDLREAVERCWEQGSPELVADLQRQAEEEARREEELADVPVTAVMDHLRRGLSGDALRHGQRWLHVEPLLRQARAELSSREHAQSGLSCPLRRWLRIPPALDFREPGLGNEVLDPVDGAPNSMLRLAESLSLNYLDLAIVEQLHRCHRASALGTLRCLGLEFGGCEVEALEALCTGPWWPRLEGFVLSLCTLLPEEDDGWIEALLSRRDSGALVALSLDAMSMAPEALAELLAAPVCDKLGYLDLSWVAVPQTIEALADSGNDLTVEVLRLDPVVEAVEVFGELARRLEQGAFASLVEVTVGLDGEPGAEVRREVEAALARLEARGVVVRRGEHL